MTFLHQKEIVLFLQTKIPGLIWLSLFGSVVNNSFDKHNSDIDIAFMSEHELSNIQRWEIQEQLASKLNIDIDLLDLSKSDDVISFEVLSKSKNIFKKKSKNLEYLLDNIYINYIQLNEDRKEIIETYL
jgi:predicted nucleotidyltransferase